MEQADFRGISPWARGCRDQAGSDPPGTGQGILGTKRRLKKLCTRHRMPRARMPTAVTPSRVAGCKSQIHIGHSALTQP
ncbi:hypothetical protein F751_0111 [Auxenochlorella protothecoides]|uniref:Uncharacterized protein n=1 Tax=Auxenochlorella protothecoides TaxID=3075 RepID=A0A087S9S0_AUXPR|nr:hypothetical protein F751_0111 [Auxenochlorella protothecoides]KFM22474.1 hypothetical protein F751_0111 [Auxenochlorella protothecoides]